MKKLVDVLMFLLCFVIAISIAVINNYTSNNIARIIVRGIGTENAN